VYRYFLRVDKIEFGFKQSIREASTKRNEMNDRSMRRLVKGKERTPAPKIVRAVKEEPKPDIYPVTRDVLCALLSQEMVYKRIRSWPLIPISSPEYKGFAKDIFILGNFNPRFKSSSAVERLEQNYPEMKYLLNNFPLVVAGSAVAKILGDRPLLKSDIDFFFYGTTITPADAEDCIHRICKHFEHLSNKANLESKLVFQRNQNVTTILHNGDKYQFIHRIYPTKDSIIGGFDLYISSVLYDGTQILATPLGAFCNQMRCNIFDLTKRSPSYDFRIKKYSTYGILHIVMGIDVSKIMACGLLKLRSTRFNLGNNHFIQFKFDPKYYRGIIHKTTVTAPEPESISDYEGLNSDFGSGYSNAKLAIAGNIDCISWSANTLSGITNPKIVSKILPSVLGTKRVKSYSGVRQFTSLFSGLDTAQKVRKFNTWIGPKSEEVFLKYTKLDNNKASINEFRDYLSDTITGLIEPNIMIARENAIRGVRWITTNPGRQWTSSLNLTPVEPCDYYNPALYTPFYIGVPEPVETLLRLCTKHKAGLFQYLNRDSLNLILKWMALQGHPTVVP
jgi:hypothetical protein